MKRPGLHLYKVVCIAISPAARHFQLDFSVLAKLEVCRWARPVDQQDGGYSSGTPGRDGVSGTGLAASLALSPIQALFLALCHRSLALRLHPRTALPNAANTYKYLELIMCRDLN